MITVSLYWLMIPVAITVVSIGIALTLEKCTGQIGDGLETILYLIPALMISFLSWIAYVVIAVGR